MSFEEIFLGLVICGFSAYLLLRMARSHLGTKDDSRGANYDRAYKRLLVGMLIGFIVGGLIAMRYNPPFRGMMDASSEEEGFFVIASWLVGGWIGVIFGAVVGLMTSGSRRKK